MLIDRSRSFDMYLRRCCMPVVSGVTYNFRNPFTDYQNGIDWHLDWGISQFISRQVHIGLVGYFYQQLTADDGQPALLGDFKSRVAAIGPQGGVLFPVGDLQGYINLKGYWEFAAENRASGWNAWVTFAVSPMAQGEAKRVHAGHQVAAANRVRTD